MDKIKIKAGIPESKFSWSHSVSDHQSVPSHSSSNSSESDTASHFTGKTKIRMDEMFATDDVQAIGYLGDSLIAACESGDEQAVQRILTSPDTNVNEQDGRGWAPLLTASEQGCLPIVQQLLAHPEIDTNLKTRNGRDVLQIACEADHSQVVEAILCHFNEQGVDIGALLYNACRFRKFQIVNHLLQYSGIESYVNYVWRDGSTPLLIACQNGDSLIVQKLLERANIAVNHRGGQGATAVYMCCQTQHVHLVRQLLKHPKIDVNLATDGGLTPLLLAAFRGSVDVIEALLTHSQIDVNKTDHLGCTPLMNACEQGHAEIVKKFVKHSTTDINQASNDGTTPLLVACISGQLDVVAQLLTHPAIDINKDRNGVTPYFAAAQKGYLEIIDKLFQHGSVDVDKHPDVIYSSVSGNPPVFPPGSSVVTIDLSDKQSSSTDAPVEPVDEKKNNNDDKKTNVEIAQTENQANSGDENNDDADLVAALALSLQVEDVESRGEESPFAKLVEHNDKIAVQIALDMLVKITGNILGNPSDKKFKSIKKSSKGLTNKVLNLQGGAAAIDGIGFQLEADVYAFDEDFKPKLSSVHQDLYIQ